MRLVLLAALAVAQHPRRGGRKRGRPPPDGRAKADFNPSWRRGETSNVYASTSAGVKLKSVDAVTRSMSWNEERHCARADESAPRESSGAQRFVVALAYDTPDPIPTLAVINSTATHCGDPSQLEFAVITTRGRRLLDLLRSPAVAARLPPGLGARVRVCDGFSQMLLERPALRALHDLRNASDRTTVSRVRRRELLSPFNFAAFYLPHVLDARRILYLDTDTLVKADVLRGLADLDMGRHAVAAVEDCSQRLLKYINFQLLERTLERHDIGELSRARFFGAGARVHNGTCVFNRGVVLFDPRRWRELGLTRTIEELVSAYVKSHARLWRGGVSQPPFLLALGGRYAKLPLEWNVRGLGRVDMSYVEYEANARGSAAQGDALARHVYRVGVFKKKFHPFVAPLAAAAKVLHFTGELKPWRIGADAARDWRSHGVAMTPSGHVSGDCRLDPNAARMKRELFVCPHARGCGDAYFANYTSTTEIFSSGCFARFSLCSSHTAPGGAEACAAVWLSYVAPEARTAWAAMERDLDGGGGAAR